MDWTRRQLLGATGVAMGLAGCTGSDTGDGGAGSDGGESGSTTTAAETTTTEPATRVTTESAGAPSDGSMATVGVASHPDLGDVLVGPDGLTLYMFDNDTRGGSSSTCSGGCARAWPPLTVDVEPTAGDGVEAELGTFERDDGSAQVTAGGWPLYAFASDENPGEANGQGVNDVWWVLRPDGTPVRGDAMAAATVQVGSHPEYGEILVGPDEMTLYMFDSDTPGQAASTCAGGCAANWPPLTVDGEASAGDGVEATLTTFEREDGTTQVAAGGWPLYYFTPDEEPGDAKGQGVNDVWWVLAPDGTPIRR